MIKTRPLRIFLLTALVAVIAAVLPSVSSAATILGTGGADRLRGTAGTDLIRAFGGNDRIRSRDGVRDLVYCGGGTDWVYSDRVDVLKGCERRPIYRNNRTWACTRRVDVPLVSVRMRSNPVDAIHLREGCTGRIGRVEVRTWTADGIKVNSRSPVAHDLVIAKGFIRCYDRAGSIHQDGVQVMGGERIAFRRLKIRCTTAGNAQFFVSAAVGGYPRNVVCVRCFMGSGAATTLRVEESYGSGARYSKICRGRYFWRVFESGAVAEVNVGNRNLRRSDSRC